MSHCHGAHVATSEISSWGRKEPSAGAARYVVALAGNPNVGKTTIFNALTGACQHVGNWPGKTVEKKEGILRHRGLEFQIVDLPGTYSLSAFSPEEVIARDFILQTHPDLVVNVVDAGNLERNLYLTVQLLELGAPLLIVLNQMDMARCRRHRHRPGAAFDIVGQHPRTCHRGQPRAGHRRAGGNHCPLSPERTRRRDSGENSRRLWCCHARPTGNGAPYPVKGSLPVASSLIAPTPHRAHGFHLHYGEEIQAELAQLTTDLARASCP